MTRRGPEPKTTSPGPAGAQGEAGERERGCEERPGFEPQGEVTLEQLPEELRELALRTRPDIEPSGEIQASLLDSFEDAPTVDGPSSATGAAARQAFADVATTDVPTQTLEPDRSEPTPGVDSGDESTAIVSYVAHRSVPVIEPTLLITPQALAAPATRSGLAAAEPTRRLSSPPPPEQETTALARSGSRDTVIWKPPGKPFGRYWLLRHIKSGGMGEVYLARAAWGHGAERDVALKRLLLPLAGSEHFVRMFVDEAEIMVQIEHPAIVQLLEFGRCDEEFFIAMEYVHGRDLETFAQTLRRRRQPFPIEIAVYIVEQVLDGLDHAHRACGADGAPLNIVHRDVSPPNILCGFGGEVKLTDFGVAKATNRLAGTQIGEIKGKLAYMSPEQLTEQEVDRRSDIFVAGAVLHELLGGRALFRGRLAMETIGRVISGPIPAIESRRPEVPDALAVVVERALQRDPERRFAHASEMRAALRESMQRHQLAQPTRALAGLMDMLYRGAPPGRSLASE